MVETYRRHRPIRSFVRREGRITAAQQRALDELWPRFGIDLNGKKLDFEGIFGRIAPIVLEIGFGNGATLTHLAEERPEANFLGIEVHRPGIGHFLQIARDKGLNNLRVIREDAVTVLRDHIPSAALEEVLILFPDPWPKKRHYKRRLIQPDFVRLLAERTKPGGALHLATDWENYAEQMMEVLSAAPGFINAAGPGQFAERPAYRPLTKFEQRGLDRGHGVWDLILKRSG